MNAISIRVFAEQLEAALKDKIKQISDQTSNEVIRYSRALAAVNVSISKLREFTRIYIFKDRLEEIEFFKSIKPAMLSQYYYYNQLIEYSIDAPKDDVEAQRQYSNSKIKELNSFIIQHFEFFKYCTSASSDLDERYFIRTGITGLDPNLDTLFSTGFDVTLSRFIANQLLVNFIKANPKAEPTSTTSRLKWTTKKTHLVELIYALHKAGAINDGKADLKEIAGSFGAIFNVSLDNLYKRFQEISLRKISKTAFLDELKAKLDARFDDID